MKIKTLNECLLENSIDCEKIKYIIRDDWIPGHCSSTSCTPSCRTYIFIDDCVYIYDFYKDDNDYRFYKSDIGFYKNIEEYNAMILKDIDAKTIE